MSFAVLVAGMFDCCQIIITNGVWVSNCPYKVLNYLLDFFCHGVQMFGSGTVEE